MSKKYRALTEEEAQTLYDCGCYTFEYTDRVVDKWWVGDNEGIGPEDFVYRLCWYYRIEVGDEQ